MIVSRFVSFFDFEKKVTGFKAIITNDIRTIAKAIEAFLVLLDFTVINSLYERQLLKICETGQTLAQNGCSTRPFKPCLFFNKKMRKAFRFGVTTKYLDT